MTQPRTIAVHALQCPQCGAPAEVAPGADVYHCRFCKTSLAIERAAPAPAPPVGRPPAAQLPFPPGTIEGDLSILRARKAKAERGGTGCLVGILIVVGAVLAVVAIAIKKGDFGSWNGKAPLVCSGNDRITVDHVTAKFSKGVAIDASGNCYVICTDCQLGAPTVIEARENATVALSHGSADGEVFAALSENGSVSTDHTKTTGSKTEPPHAGPGGKPTWPEKGPFVCGANGDGGEFSNVKVKVDAGAAIVASVNCQIKLSHCTIEGPVGLLLSDNADVELDDCEVRATDAVVARANGSLVLEGGTFVGTDHAARLEDNASLRAHGAKVSGSKATQANAKVEIE